MAQLLAGAAVVVSEQEADLLKIPETEPLVR
jgi:hypothetical protein